MSEPISESTPRSRSWRARGVVDLAGQTFGRLTVLRRAARGPRAWWVCQCLCGKETEVRSWDLRSGKARGCGCLASKPLVDILGHRFGKLLVLGRHDQLRRWLVRCECGREKLAATRWRWGEPPAEGMTTFVSEAKTAGRRSRRHPPGHCFRMAGFEEVGRTRKGGFVVLRLSPERFPAATPIARAQLEFWDAA